MAKVQSWFYLVRAKREEQAAAASRNPAVAAAHRHLQDEFTAKAAALRSPRDNPPKRRDPN